MKLLLNGQPVEIASVDIAALLAERGIDASQHGIAVAVNGRIVTRARWAESPLAEGDEVEVITAMQGG